MQVGTHGLANAFKQMDEVSCLEQVEGHKTPGLNLLNYFSLEIISKAFIV
jgi:hypothetical protein